MNAFKINPGQIACERPGCQHQATWGTISHKCPSRGFAMFDIVLYGKIHRDAVYVCNEHYRVLTQHVPKVNAFTIPAKNEY